MSYAGRLVAGASIVLSGACMPTETIESAVVSSVTHVPYLGIEQLGGPYDVTIEGKDRTFTFSDWPEACDVGDVVRIKVGFDPTGIFTGKWFRGKSVYPVRC